MNKPVGDLKPEAEVSEPRLALLRRPFEDHQISKKPAPSKSQTEALKANRSLGVNCRVCGGWHHKDAVHLDYVGHAALTDRLLDTDLEWNWDPMAFTPEGLPLFDKSGGLWIKLTICGVTRPGYGSADGKSGGDAVKEIIGDALRNAGMRFGAALDLWHKGDLHITEEEPAPNLEERAIAHLNACAVDKAAFKSAWEQNKDGWKKTLDGKAYANVVKVMKDLAAKFPAEDPPPAAEPEPEAEDLGIGDDNLPEAFR